LLLLLLLQVMGPEALLKQKIKQKRHREGYEEGLSSSHRWVGWDRVV
jgi:AdoMet-dependent rRNA methyltransferase SPB1